MTARIQKDIRERVPDLAWRAEDASVKPFGDHRTAAAEGPVQRTRDAGADGHHPATERFRVRRLHDEVRVRVLQAVVNDAEVAARANGGEAALERVDEFDGAQRGQAREQLHCHVCGQARGKAAAPTVRNARLRTGLSSGAGAAAAPSAGILQPETELDGTIGHHGLE